VPNIWGFVLVVWGDAVSPVLMIRAGRTRLLAKVKPGKKGREDDLTNSVLI
jgi:hypothetical protein